MKYAFLIFLFVNNNLFAANNHVDSIYLLEHYSKAEYQIPMRDEVKLYTIVYSPKDNSIKYPILLNRTPYNIAPYGTDMKFTFRRGLSPAFLREGYIFVFQDVRGRFMSEGVFQHMTPFIDDKKSKNDVDESSDAYDTMEWLIKNLENQNGRILSETGIAAGVRRIEAVTGQAALDWLHKLAAQADALGKLLSGSFEDALLKVPNLLKRQKELEKEVSILSAAAAASDLDCTAAWCSGGQRDQSNQRSAQDWIQPRPCVKWAIRCATRWAAARRYLAAWSRAKQLCSLWSAKT